MKYIILFLILPLSVLGQDIIIQDMGDQWAQEFKECDHYYGSYAAEQVIEAMEFFPFSFEECTRLNMHYRAYRVEVYGHENLKKVTLTVFINVGDMEVAVLQQFAKKSKVNTKVSELFYEILYDEIGKE